MAIFKSSNCKPFLGSIDLTQKQYFQCEVNTSNILATGYKIRILDSLNEVIFEGLHYTPIPGQMGLNGSILTFPVVVTEESELNYNNIYYRVANGKWYRKTGASLKAEILKFRNGYINQPYKWKITLAQGDILNQLGESQHPTVKWYDMIIATGQILGSTLNRIQSDVSDEVYKDYYVQLCRSRYNENSSSRQAANSFVGVRKRILRYDSSLGYIYPEEGQFTKEAIAEAKYAQVFKNTNDPQVVESSKFVDYATTIPLKDVGNNYSPLPQSTTVSYANNYLYMTHIFGKRPSGELIGAVKVSIKRYDTDFTGDPEEMFISGSTRLLVKNEPQGAQKNNGIYVYVDQEYTPHEDGNGSTIILKWKRTTDANAWANFIGKAFYVKSGSSAGLNFETNADTRGVINSSDLIFSAEKPVELYPNATTWQDKNFGPVYHNSTTETLIRPFIGIAPDMKFKYVLNGIENDLNINSINTKNWTIKHDALSAPLPIETPYTISSYFKQGDDNPFFAYDTPILTINDEMFSAVGGEYELNQHFLKATGDYFQAQNKGWKNFHWSLLNLNYNHRVTTEVSYAGVIEALFEGLEAGNKYELTLIVEDDLGLVHSTTIYFKVELKNIVEGNFFSTAAFDCLTHSIDIKLTQQALILPDPIESDVGIDYSEGTMEIISTHGRDYGVKYNQVQIINNENIKSALAAPGTNSVTINSEHILNPWFEGVIFELIIADMFFDKNKGSRIKVRAEVPTEVVLDKETGMKIANPERNQIIIAYWQENTVDGGESWIEAPLTLNRGYATIIDSETLSKSCTWRLSESEQDKNIVFGFEDPFHPFVDKDYDYLITDKAYNINDPYGGEELSEGYRHLTKSIFNCEAGPISFPLTSATGGSNLRVWGDFAFVLARQKDSSYVNCENLNSLKTWNDGGSSWNDLSDSPSFSLYRQTDVNEENNFSGRQEIHNKALTFNISIANFDLTQTTQQTELKIVRQCFVSRLS